MEAVSLTLAFPALAPKPAPSPAPSGPPSSAIVDPVAIVARCMGDVCARPLVRDFLVGLVVLVAILWLRGDRLAMPRQYPVSWY